MYFKIGNILLLSIVMILFQNCSLELFSEKGDFSPTNKSFLSGIEGNGDTYDGKIQRYLRRAPGFDCENKSDEYANIFLMDSVPYITIHKENQCGSPIPIDPQDIIRSKNTNKFIGYREGVYKVEADHAPEEGVYVEAWCRATLPSSDTLEVFVEWDSNKKSAKAIIYDSLGEKEGFGKTTGTEMELTKRQNHYGVFYNRPNRLGIQLYFNQQSLDSPFEVKGKVSGMKNQNWQTVNVDCRKGGEFDVISPTLHYDEQNSLLALGQEMPNLHPVLNKQALSYESTPPLPKGLMLDRQSGTISGIPQELQNSKIYKITANFKSGSISSNIHIGVGNQIQVAHLNDPLSTDEKIGSCRNCSLRDAVNWANLSPFPTVIELPIGRIKLNGHHLVINSDIKILGQGFSKTIIDANFSSRIVFLNPNTHVQLKGVSLINGRAEGQGGAIYSKNAFLEVISSKFDNNKTVFNNPPDQNNNLRLRFREGGAIFSEQGRLTLKDSLFTNNEVAVGTGSVQGGGGVYSHGDLLHIEKSHFENNRSSSMGGGLHVYGSISEIIDSQFIGNFGGGAYIRSGAHQITGCLFAENYEYFRGGGLHVFWTSTASINDSTFFNNYSMSGSSLYYQGARRPIFVTNTSIIHENSIKKKFRYTQKIVSLAEFKFSRVVFRNSTISSSLDSVKQNCKSNFLDDIDGRFFMDNLEPSGFNMSNDDSCNFKIEPGSLAANPLIDFSQWKTERTLYFLPNSPTKASGGMKYCSPGLIQADCHMGSLKYR